MSARDEVRREYIIGALREAGAMYEPDARNYLADHEAVIRAQALREAGDALERRSVELGFDSGLSAGAGILWCMADAATPTSKESR